MVDHEDAFQRIVNETVNATPDKDVETRAEKPPGESAVYYMYLFLGTIIQIGLLALALWLVNMLIVDVWWTGGGTLGFWTSISLSASLLLGIATIRRATR